MKKFGKFNGDNIFGAVNICILVILCLIMLYPLYFTVIASVSEPVDVATGKVTFWPEGFTWDAYKEVFKQGAIWTGYRNAIINTILGTIWNLFLTIPAAYAMSKTKMRFHGALSIFFAITMFFSGGLLPYFLLVKNLGLMNKPYTLIILGGFSVFNMVVARTYFQTSIPETLYDAAEIDGCSQFGQFFRIALPLAKPIIAVIALYYAVGRWNDYFTSAIFISNSDYYPLQLVLRDILINSRMALASINTKTMTAEQILYLTRQAYMAEAMKYAIIFIASLPLLIAYAGNDEMTSWRVGSMMSCVDLNQAQNVRPIKKKTSGNTKEISYEIKIDDTIILAEVSLDENCAYMNFRFNVVWTKLGSKEKGVPQLRFMLPCGYVPRSYKYTVPFGVVERKPLAQDVPATGLGCAVPDNGTSALYLVCNTKYGFRGDRDGLSLNLIRSSFDPDPYPEVGEHRIHLAIGVCEPEESTLAKISAKSNHPVITRTFAGSLQQNKNLIRVEGGIVSAVKNAEDGNGFIIRVFNPTKEDKQIRVEIPGKRIRTQLCDFLECSQTELTETFDEAQYMLGCNKVCTIRVITE